TRCQRTGSWTLYGLTPVRAFAQECGELVTGELDGFLPLRYLLASRRQCRLGLTQLEPRIHACLVAILCQLEDLLTLREGRLRNVQLQIGPFELNVGMRNA